MSVFRFYTFYECVATNTLGQASINIQLKQGFVPGAIGQVRTNTITATTIKFSIVPPSNYDGLPIRSYSVEYKPERQPTWEYAQKHTWSNGKLGVNLYSVALHNCNVIIRYDYFGR